MLVLVVSGADTMSFRLGISGACLASLSVAACGASDDAHNDRPGQAEAVASSTPTLLPANSQLQAVTCSYPVRKGDTAASLRNRYGEDARGETLYGIEGAEFEGVALWPDDPARRVEVFFAEDGTGEVSAVHLWDKAERRVAGLGLGDTLAQVRAANGGPFQLWGFSWDYGGYVNDLLDGRLETLPGGCRLSIRLDIPEGVEVPPKILGEGSISSDDPQVKNAHPRVVELTLGFPED
jgi:hypothetical protein